MATALALLGVAGCGGTGGGAGSRVPGPGTDRPDEGPDGEGGREATADPRALGVTSTFGDLVAAARRLDDRFEADSDAGCLLRGSGAGSPFRLEADIAVAVRPLPDAPPDLDARLGATGLGIRALTRWGSLGAGDDLALVVFTSTPPVSAPSAVLLAITDRGAFVIPIGTSRERMGPVPLAEALSRVAARTEGDPAPIVVTAEEGVSLAILREALTGLSASVAGLVALAVPLAEGTRLPPDPAAQADNLDGACPDGLPEPAPGAAFGDLPPAAILEGLRPLRDGAAQCFANTTGRAASGGRVGISVRIGADGAVIAACVSDDGIGDPGLRSCLVELARASRFPAPSPAGIVDAVLPLVLRPDDSMRQRPICP